MEAFEHHEDEVTAWIVPKKEVFTMEVVEKSLSSEPDLLRYARKLLKRLDPADAVDDLMKTLQELKKVCDTIKGHSEPLSPSKLASSLLRADALDKLLSIVETNEMAVDLKLKAMKLLRTLTKTVPERLGHPKCVLLLIKALDTHPSNFEVHLSVFRTFLQFTDSQHEGGIRTMIMTPGCLELLAGSADNFFNVEYGAIKKYTAKIFKNISTCMSDSGKRAFPDWVPVPVEEDSDFSCASNSTKRGFLDGFEESKTCSI